MSPASSAASGRGRSSAGAIPEAQLLRPTTAAVDWDALSERPGVQLVREVVAARIADRRVLVTGAAGSLGSPLVELLAGCGPEELTLADLHESSLFRLRSSLGETHPRLRARYCLADVRDRARTKEMFADARPHLVYHLAARKHVPWGEDDPLEFASVNVVGARNVALAAAAAGAGQIVYPSTDKAVDPPSFYGATKRLTELLLFALAARGGPHATVIRFVNVLGSQGSAPETFVRQIGAGRPLSLTDPAMRRFWITPGHALALLAHAACVTDRSATVLPDCGNEVSVQSIAERLWRQLRPGREGPPLVVTGLRPGERLSEPIARPDEELELGPLPGLFLVRRPGYSPPDLDALLLDVQRLEEALTARAPAATIRAMVTEVVEEAPVRV